MTRRAMQRRRRSGSTYLIVLGSAMIVSALAYCGLLLVRTEGRRFNEAEAATIAQRNAESGVELARLWIAQDANWRTTRPQGIWANNLSLSDGTTTVEVRDPIDANFVNRPHDPVIVKVTGRSGDAKHIVQVQLDARPTPLPALAFAAHTQGQLHVRAGKTLDAGTTKVSTNTETRNDGTILGGLETLTASPQGTVVGPVVLGATFKSFPTVDVVAKYEALGTLISPGPSIDMQAIGPGRNPWGTANAEGVYVVRPSGDFTIKNSRIYGTLVVILSVGKKLTVSNNVLMHPVRADYPTLVVRGDATLQYSSTTLLDESVFAVSFNPNGVPYNGDTNGNKNETYPSEIQGLVHATGKVELKQTARIRGAVLAEGSGNDSLDVNDAPQIVYTPSLFLSPPQWYTTEVKMIVKRGSWTPLVN